jgi:hypothetical protein
MGKGSHRSCNFNVFLFTYHTKKAAQEQRASESGERAREKEKRSD